MSPKQIVLIDSTEDSLTVSWPAIPGAERYVLQYKRAASSEDDGDNKYETLSENLKSTQARKRNLSGVGNAFEFRVRSASDDDGHAAWISHGEHFSLLTADQQNGRMMAPTAVADGNQAAIIRWKAPASGNSDGYELQMRENDGGVGWSTVAPRLGGTEVRKKNLASRLGYQFRVRPVPDAGGAFSSPSAAVVGRVLSEGMKRLFADLEGGTLLRGSKSVPLADALAGKEFVLLYASAHWCGPCRQFTPQLANYYKAKKSQPGGDSVEIVFLSADHDEGSFQSYFSSMPWLAVPFDSEAREGLMAHIRVSGIPRLCVLEGKTGRIIEDNAVGKSMDIGRWRQLAGVK